MLHHAAAALPFLALGLCAMPGMNVDVSRLGTAPIGQQARHAISFDDEYASRFAGEWLREQCAIVDVETARACGEKLGMTCPAVSNADAVCDYAGVYRTRSISFVGSPSLSSQPTSPWSTYHITMRLTFVGQAGAMLNVHRQILPEGEQDS